MAASASMCSATLRTVALAASRSGRVAGVRTACRSCRFPAAARSRPRRRPRRTPLCSRQSSYRRLRSGGRFSARLRAKPPMSRHMRCASRPRGRLLGFAFRRRSPTETTANRTFRRAPSTQPASVVRSPRAHAAAARAAVSKGRSVRRQRMSAAVPRMFALPRPARSAVPESQTLPASVPRAMTTRRHAARPGRAVTPASAVRPRANARQGRRWRAAPAPRPAAPITRAVALPGRRERSATAIAAEPESCVPPASVVA